MPVNSLMTFVQFCPNLKKLHATVLPLPTLFRGSLVLEELEDLILDYVDSGEHNHGSELFLDKLLAPRLRRLVIHCPKASQRHSFLERFIQQSFQNPSNQGGILAPLEELVVYGSIVNDMDLIRALRLVPNLQVLEVKYMQLTMEHLIALELREADGRDPQGRPYIVHPELVLNNNGTYTPLCPQLRELDWEDAGGADFWRLVAMICSRVETAEGFPPPTLERIVLGNLLHTEDDFCEIPKIQNAVHRGLKLVCSSPPSCEPNPLPSTSTNSSDTYCDWNESSEYRWF